MTPEQLAGWLQLGGGGLMLAALIVGHRRLWVFGWYYQAKVDECEQWKRIALRGLDLTETTVQNSLSPGQQADHAQDIVRRTGG